MSEAVRKFKAALPRPPRRNNKKAKAAAAASAAADATPAIPAEEATSPTSPDKEDNRQWATGRKLAFLTSRIDAWRLALDLEEVSNFYDNFVVTWIAMWGWDTPEELDVPPAIEDPSEVDLEAVFAATEKSSEEAQRRRRIFWHLRGVRANTA